MINVGKALFSGGNFNNTAGLKQAVVQKSGDCYLRYRALTVTRPLTQLRKSNRLLMD